MDEALKKYKGKVLCDLNSHTASDKSTGSIGDIQINNEYREPFEGIEIKAREIHSSMIDIIYSKIQKYSTVERYYILSTFENLDSISQQNFNEKVNKIRSKHGCEVIINGVYTTLKYFLRLMNTRTFLEYYTHQVSIDSSLKYEHKIAWNKICSYL